MTYSSYIDQIVAWLRGCGVRTWCGPPPAHCPDHVGGSYDHEGRSLVDDYCGPTICVYSANARNALMCLAHEAGHWLGYLICRKPLSHMRERQAYVYGWHVLQWFGAPISRDEWRADCREDAAYKRNDPEYTSRA